MASESINLSFSVGFFTGECEIEVQDPVQSQREEHHRCWRCGKLPCEMMRKHTNTCIYCEDGLQHSSWRNFKSLSAFPDGEDVSPTRLCVLVREPFIAEGELGGVD